MPNIDPQNQRPTILIAGASRGLGHAMAEEFVAKGWHVMGTIRKGATDTQLHDLARTQPDRVEIETLDTTDPDQIAALRARLGTRKFDILFVNAGTTNRNPNQTIGEVSTEDFVHVMITNALGPMRVVESLSDNVAAGGMIGVMSSGQGSIANNETGMREVYRGTKAALNMYMRCFASHADQADRAMVVMAPGWVKTELGGPEARLTIGESIPSLVNVLLEKRGKPGLEYLDYLGRTVPW